MGSLHYEERERQWEYEAQQKAEAEAIRKLKIEPKQKHTQEHYDWFKRNFAHLISFPPGHQTTEEDIQKIYLKYHPMTGGRRMRYKTNRRRVKTNRRRVKTNRRRVKTNRRRRKH
jgi:hypothetical protein